MPDRSTARPPDRSDDPGLLDLTLRPRPPADAQLDPTDEAILWQLLRNARISNAALAQAVHLSPSATLARVRALRASGALAATRAQVDLAAVGLAVQAVVAVRLQAQARTALKAYAERVIRLPQVVNLFFVGGPDDFLVHVACASTAHLRDLVADRLSMDPAVAATRTHIVFDHLDGFAYTDHLHGFDDLRGR